MANKNEEPVEREGSLLLYLTAGLVLVGAAVLATSQSVESPLSPLISLLATIPASLSSSGCRCFPGDECWPAPAQWDALNKTVEGRLEATVPLASPCHDGFPGVGYDAETCAVIQKLWDDPALHYETAHSPMSALFANMSCDPFTDREAPCALGSYAPYAVRASSAADYKETIRFARKHNIRLVIRNTGHDYSGKSTGAGALTLWTHYLKDRSVVDYASSHYTGKAMKMGAGTQAYEADEVAREHGLILVAGDCPSLGLAGGYTQGGGSSALAGKFGLAADQVLEWEVVTADGELRVATPDNENSDLYWALSGGGGGTFGAVLSMTVRLHKDMPTAGAGLSFTEQSDSFWGLVQTFLVHQPAIVDAGGSIYWMLLPGNVFAVPEIYLPNGTAEELTKLLEPTIKALEEKKVPFEFNAVNFSGFQEAYYGVGPQATTLELNIGGRLIPRSLVATDVTAAALTDAIKSIVATGAAFFGVAADTSRPPPSPNSVNPAWRDALFLTYFGIPYDRSSIATNVAAQELVTNMMVPLLEALTPGGGAYMSAADLDQPQWQETFYGSNYPRLLSLKNKYDPEGIFWVQTGVGSEKLAIKGDGRLCRASPQDL